MAKKAQIVVEGVKDEGACCLCLGAVGMQRVFIVNSPAMSGDLCVDHLTVVTKQHERKEQGSLYNHAST